MISLKMQIRRIHLVLKLISIDYLVALQRLEEARYFGPFGYFLYLWHIAVAESYETAERMLDRKQVLDGSHQVPS